MPTKQELIKLGKFYLYLGVLGLFVYLMVKPLSPVISQGNSLVEAAKLSVQTVIVNPNIKQIAMFFLLLYTTFVVIESLIMIRGCIRELLGKNKGNNVTE